MTSPPCMHCGEAFSRHEARDNERWCRDGKHRFNVEFQVNPEVVHFVKEHSDKSSKELADLWIERVRGRKP